MVVRDGNPSAAADQPRLPDILDEPQAPATSTSSQPQQHQAQDPDPHAAPDYLDPRKRRNYTSPFLTKYEKTRVLGKRVQQIQLSAPILIPPEMYRMPDLDDPNGNIEPADPERIAELELEMGKIPFIIRRYLPVTQNTSSQVKVKYEDWRVKDLIDPETF
eukprot:g5802.t1